MSTQTYTYPDTAFKNGVFDAASLKLEIEAPESGIEIQLFGSPSGTVIGGVPSCVLTFKGSVNLSALNAIVAAHEGISIDTPDPVTVTNPGLKRSQDSVLYSVPKPSLFGSVMCDRDFRMNTGLHDPAASFEDLYVSPTDNKQHDWGEMAFVGCFKDVSGVMTPTESQLDADANAVLSIWDYCARNPITRELIQYELRDGTCYVDPTIFADPSMPTAQERYGHVVYAVVAPDIPGFMGGRARFFDGYLGSDVRNLNVEVLSPQAHVLDPNDPDTGGPLGVCLRTWIFYPQGTKHSHTMRLVTYRAPGSFPE